MKNWTLIQCRRGSPLRTLKILTVSILIFFMLSSMVLMDNSEAQDDLPEWTFMVYLDADNNLEGAGIEDMNEMEAYGSDENVNIIVQMDRIDDYSQDDGDWRDCRRFYVEKDTDPSRITSRELDILGEVNMGDPETLIDFVLWAHDEYPAKKYALVLWNHGGAFRGICFDDTVPELGPGEHDAINMTELNYAAKEIYKGIGNRKIDLWGFDACLMAQVAVMYELKDFAKVGVGSGYNEPGEGWPYEKILSNLQREPEMDERQLARHIVHEYIYSYNDRKDDPQDYPMVTQAAFDLTKMDQLASVLDEFSEELASRGPLGSLDYLIQIYQARKNANSYDMANVFIYDLTGYPLYDVIDFTYYLEDYILTAFPKNSLILDLCERVRKTIFDENNPDESFMFYSEADQWHPDANGLSMYFPNKEEDALSLTQIPTNYLISYEETSYAKEHTWDNFLHAYYGIDPIIDSFPTISITEPEFNMSYPEDERVIILRGTAYDREMIDRVEIRVNDGEWQVMPGITGQGRIPWLHQMDISQLDPGTHTISVRAFDKPTSETGGNVGKVTHPVSLEITIEEHSQNNEREFEVPRSFISGILIAIIVVALVLGVIMVRGRNE